MPLRIVLATIGSLGDLHPFLALALSLRQRGFDSVIATHEYYRGRVEGTGIGFYPLRPDYQIDRADLTRLAMDPWRGPEFIFRDTLFPAIRDTYEDLTRAAQGADLLISHGIVFAAPLVAAKSGLPWVSVVLAPAALLSTLDETHALPLPWLNRVLNSSRATRRLFFNLVRARSEPWCRPVYELRSSLGLTVGSHPLFEGAQSPQLGLALFSRFFSPPLPDWPESVRQTGFVFYDVHQELPADLIAFLDSGPPPIVFTLGSAAVLDPGSFFVESAKAVRRLARRALFLVGSRGGHGLPSDLPADVFVAPYAPFSAVFPRAAAVVHQGGIGTTAQALRAGRPSLVVPFAHDQPDNAHRLERLGTAFSITRRRYNARTAAFELARLLDTPSVAQNAARMGLQIASEDGLGAACLEIERFLAR